MGWKPSDTPGREVSLREVGHLAIHDRRRSAAYAPSVMPNQGEAWSSARMPVFASVPSKLDDAQRESRRYVYDRLHRVFLDPRTVGGTDRGLYNPLHEVRTLARHCAGGIILGYQQTFARRAFQKTREGTIVVEASIGRYFAPTPWNQLETGILFGLGLPLLVLKQENITGGIFDEGASDVFVHKMPMPGAGWESKDPENLETPDECRVFESVLLKWQALVTSHYYGET